MKNKKNIIWIVLTIILVIGAVKTIKNKKAQEAKIGIAKQYAINVDTKVLKTNDVILTLPYLATINSSQDTQILSKISARVIYIAPLGTKVKKGDIVLKLDNKDILSKIESLKLAINSTNIDIIAKQMVLDNLILTHKRTKELLDVKGASIEQYQNEQDKIILTQASIEALKNNIKINQAKIDELDTLNSYSILTSPTNAIVSKTMINLGQTAMAGHPLIFLSSTKGKYLELNLPNSIKPKQIIFNKKYYTPIVLNNTKNGLNQYKIGIDTNLNVGSKVDIKVVIFHQKAIKIPTNGVLQNGGNNYIFVVSKNKAIQTKVKILASGEEGLAIDTKYNNKKIVLAKPDIFLKLISGIDIKE